MVTKGRQHPTEDPLCSQGDQGDVVQQQVEESAGSPGQVDQRPEEPEQQHD